MKTPTEGTYWVDSGRILAGPYPGALDPEETTKKMAVLIDAGVDLFVNLMEADEANGDGQPFAGYMPVLGSGDSAVQMKRFAIKDQQIPSTDEMKAVLDAIDRHLDAGGRIYLHCWGGVGRTGTVVGCWLLRHRRATPDNVLDKLAGLRKADKVRGRRISPETPQQRTFVTGWDE